MTIDFRGQRAQVDAIYYPRHHYKPLGFGPCQDQEETITVEEVRINGVPVELTEDELSELEERLLQERRNAIADHYWEDR